ncbi:MAG: nitroreductase family deazaflavin-dependent oxidoreductase [Egibacteraceae bacterium]
MDTPTQTGGTVRDRTLRLVERTFVTGHNSLYRRTGGRIGARFRGAPILLLTTTGRKTGKARTTPLIYLASGDQLVLFASNEGAARMPTWYLNLTANPTVEVQRGPHVRRMTARDATPAEHARLWPKMVEVYRHYETYQSKTTRQFPIIILSPE